MDKYTWTGRCRTASCAEHGKLFSRPDGSRMRLKDAACPTCRKPLRQTALALIAAPVWSELRPVRQGFPMDCIPTGRGKVNLS